MRALWTLDGLDAIEPAAVMAALDDDSRDVRVGALRIAERWLGEAGHPVQAAVLRRSADSDWAVRQQYAATIGALPPPLRDPAAAALLERLGGDPIVADAVLSGLAGEEATVVNLLLAHSDGRPPNAPVTQALTMLSATIPEHLSELPRSGRPGHRWHGRTARRLGVCGRAAGHPDPHRPQRKGG